MFNIIFFVKSKLNSLYVAIFDPPKMKIISNLNIWCVFSSTQSYLVSSPYLITYYNIS